MKNSSFDQLLQSLKKDYAKSFPEKIEKLRQLTLAKKWKELEVEYHNLNGNGKTYGFPEISQMAEQMENLCMNAEHKPYFLFEHGLQTFVDLFERLSKNTLKQTLQIKKESTGSQSSGKTKNSAVEPKKIISEKTSTQQKLKKKKTASKVKDKTTTAQKKANKKKSAQKVKQKISAAEKSRKKKTK
jgi:HPt (histidine-containing phosphotransfer) domain-containing protein